MALYKGQQEEKENEKEEEEEYVELFIPIETVFDNAYKRYRLNGVGEQVAADEIIDTDTFFKKVRQNLIDSFKNLV